MRKINKAIKIIKVLLSYYILGTNTNMIKWIACGKLNRMRVFLGFDPFLLKKGFLFIFELNGIKLNEQLN